jgi:lambda repressor-like predicted transcriptional regulator
MVADAILSALREAHRSKRWLAAQSGIAYSTLRRKLDAQVDISVVDLARIAQALDRSPASMLPDLRTGAGER